MGWLTATAICQSHSETRMIVWEWVQGKLMVQRIYGSPMVCTAPCSEVAVCPASRDLRVELLQSL